MGLTVAALIVGVTAIVIVLAYVFKFGYGFRQR